MTTKNDMMESIAVTAATSATETTLSAEEIALQEAQAAAEAARQASQVMVTPATTHQKEYTVEGVTYTASFTNSKNILLNVHRFSSEAEEMTIPAEFDGQPLKQVSFAAADLPNVRVLTLSEGITDLIGGVELPRVEILTLPSTLSYFSAGTDEAYEAVERHYLYQIKSVIYDLDPEALASSERWQYIRMARLLSGYESSGSYPLVTMPSLKEVHVADGNEVFWSEKGMLYSDCYASIERYVGYEPQKQLIAVPRQYSPESTVKEMTYTTDENGNQKPSGWTRYHQLVIPEGTDYIHMCAIYKPETYSYVKIPDSVTRIAPAAIVGTESNPLTVVCKSGSAAEAYVKAFGEVFHLRLVGDRAREFS